MAKSKRQQLAIKALRQLVGDSMLSELEEMFVVEYTRDYSHRRAAEAIGLHPDKGIEWISKEKIAEAVRMVYNHQMQASDLTAETVKEEMFTLYQLAMHKGQYSVAAKLLDQLAKHSHVDAYAAQKVAVSADAAVAKALAGGRRRIAEHKEKQKYDFS